MAENKRSKEPAPEITTPTYRGPDRRKRRSGNGIDKATISAWADEEQESTWASADEQPHRRVNDDFDGE